MKKLIVANWKMLPTTLAEAEGILEFTNNYLESLSESKEFSLVFCPPFVFIEEVAKILKMSHFEHEAFLGAQDIAIDDKTTLTGEVSGQMLAKLGVRYVIIGHSERRWKLGESDEVVNKKLKSALQNELIPIVCIGERTRLRPVLRQRLRRAKQGFGGQTRDWKDFLRDQTMATFEGLTADEVGKCIIAYEPVWAISTNPSARPDTSQSALESMKIIKETLTFNFQLSTLNLFLYGGSVNSKNAGDFLKEKEIDGVLIGGASVNKEEFVKVLQLV